MAETNMRDYQHAHRLYTQQRMNFSPKVKFLYHCVFELSTEARSHATISVQEESLLNVLVKSVDLPSYSASVETRQQYNRKKNVQTRVDYDPITVKWHDDKAGVTMSLLQEYYTYYFKDGNYNDGAGSALGQTFGARDKYKDQVPNYGLDNGRQIPFFKQIKIFQLSRNKWNSFTLINPIVERWQHDTMDSSDGIGIAENTMTIMYEGVIYDHGEVEIGPNGEPKTFGDPRTGYDATPSPLGNQDLYPNQQSNYVLENQATPVYQSTATMAQNPFSIPGSGSFSNGIQSSPGGLAGLLFPNSNRGTTASNQQQSSQVRDGSDIVSVLLNNPSIRNTVIRKVIGTGNATSIGLNNLSQYNTLSEIAQLAVTNQVLDSIGLGGNRQALNIASSVIDAVGETSKVNRSTGTPNLTGVRVQSPSQAADIISRINANGATSDQQRAFVAAETANIPGLGVATEQAILDSDLSPVQKRAAVLTIQTQRKLYNSRYT
jgi:hypothetical protein